VDYEIEILSNRFNTTKQEIQKSINFYFSLNFSGVPYEYLINTPIFIDELENITELHGDYLGIALTIDVLRNKVRKMGQEYVSLLQD